MINVPFTTRRNCQELLNAEAEGWDRLRYRMTVVVLNAATLRDVQRWARDELDETTRRELMT